MHPNYGALPVPYVPLRVARVAVIVHRYTYAPPCCRTSQYRQNFIQSVSLWNDLSDPVFDGVGRGFQQQSQCLFIGLAARSLFVVCCFPFLFFHSMGWCCGVGVFRLIGC